MEKAKVYFSDLRTSPTSNLLDKMERLLKRAGHRTASFKRQFYRYQDTFRRTGQSGVYPS